jgi:hypothetical protein
LNELNEKVLGKKVVDDLGGEWLIIQRFEGDYYYGAVSLTGMFLSEAIGKSVMELIMEIQAIEEVKIKWVGRR